MNNKYYGILFLILAIYTAASFKSEGVIAVPFWLGLSIYFFYREWKKNDRTKTSISGNTGGNVTIKKVKKVFDSNHILLRRVPNNKLRQKPNPNLNDNYEIGKRYPIYTQAIYGDPEYGFGDAPQSERRYVLCFYTDKHIQYLKGYFGENFRIEFVDEPFNQLLAFAFGLDTIEEHEWNYFTHIIVNHDNIELFVKKEDYDNYIAKKIPHRTAYPTN